MKKSYVPYIFSLFLFSTCGIAANFTTLTSYEVVLLRSLIGAPLLVAVFLIGGNRFSALRHKRDLCFVLLSGAAMAADWLLLFEAYAQIGVSLSILINFCGPAVVIILSPVLLHERVTGAKIAALVIALTGAALVMGEVSGGGVNTLGLLCAAVSALAYAAMVLFNKLSREIKGFENAVIQLLGAAVTVVIFVGCKQGLAVHLAASDWLPVLWLGVIGTGLGCSLYMSSVSRLPAQSVAVCGYAEPLFSVLLSAIVLHEVLTGLQWLGAVLIIGGALYGELKKPKVSIT